MRLLERCGDGGGGVRRENSFVIGGLLALPPGGKQIGSAIILSDEG